jgi:(2Fe-2S) ferredoxin
VREFDLEKAWAEAIRNGTALCLGGCGDRPVLMRLYGRHTGCWCRECWEEVARGVIRPLKRKRG